MKFTGLATTCIIAIIVAENPPRYCTNCFATFEVPKYHLHKTFHVLPNNDMSTSLVLKFASYSFSLSFNFAHLVQIYSRSFKFAQVFSADCISRSTKNSRTKRWANSSTARILTQVRKMELTDDIICWRLAHNKLSSSKVDWQCFYFCHLPLLSL